MSARTAFLLAAALSFAGGSALTAAPENADLAVDVPPAVGMARFAATCEDFDAWDKPAEPFQIHGNTWYVGTCGIAAILIATDEGHALIDTGTEAGAEVVLANIRKLGFDPADIKLIATSHEHFDHVGGVAKVQQVTGAVVIASEIGIEVLKSGIAHPDDPQAGMHEPMAKIAHGMPWFWGEAPYRLDYFGLKPILTPGHTPGALSWRWQACAGSDCKAVVFADSLNPISADAYRFSDHPAYVAAFREGIARIAETPCDILLTPHPSSSDMLTRARTGSFAGGMSCADYAASKTKALDDRLAKEAAAK
jgi:metallo-beta-lactamase class B